MSHIHTLYPYIYITIFVIIKNAFLYHCIYTMILLLYMLLYIYNCINIDIQLINRTKIRTKNVFLMKLI